MTAAAAELPPIKGTPQPKKEVFFLTPLACHQQAYTPRQLTFNILVFTQKVNAIVPAVLYLGYEFDCKFQDEKA